jgi:hypothetical protein
MTDHELHHALARLDRLRLSPALADDDWEMALENEYALRAREIEFIERERAHVAPTARETPTTTSEFRCWFSKLGARDPDPLFAWLAERASLAQLQWFLRQELAGESGFVDLVALIQLHMPVRAKLELARNYWDGVGRGASCAMHDPVRDRLANVLGGTPAPLLWEALAVGNLVAGLAANRRYAYHAVGALGMALLTDPTEILQVDAGLERCGVAARAREYCSLHAGLGVEHARTWSSEVIEPMIAPALVHTPAIAARSASPREPPRTS